MGRQEQANYKEQEIHDYIGNPLIESLPPIFSVHEIANMLYNTPVYRDKDREKPPEVRLHMVEQIKNYMHPLKVHFDLHFKVSIMIRRGYVARNPLSPFYARQFTVGIEKILKEDLDENGKNLIGNQSTATSHSIIGISGIGKTTAIEKVLLTYPQVIVHSNYKNQERELGFLKQIVWLKLECPFNGRRKALCQNFFRVVDQILQTQYYNKFVKPRSTEEELIDTMAHVCTLHGLGVLVIDEIQRMKPGEVGQEMLDFFVELSNKLGIPLIYVGTYKATQIFNKLLANARRAEGMGSDFIDPMVQDKEWDLFLERLWKFQWTRKKVPLTKDLNDTMYYLTMGITDFIIRLFTQAQQYAIAYDIEELTPSLIKKVAKKNMKFAEPILNGLRNGDREVISKFEDIKPNWVEVNDYIKIMGERINLVGGIKKEHKRVINQGNSPRNFEKLIESAINLGVSPKDATKIASKVIESTKGMQDMVQMQRALAKYVLQGSITEVKEGKRIEDKAKKIKPIIEKGDIRYYMENAKRKKLPIDHVLEEASIIKSFSEFRS
ncbi:ATP-binding protein [Oceanobacillus kapialis]|uniref:ATP-binding protein n=1 Tax=Oceanobacillus kapialis TaxID=481353 RepID=UPI00385151E1